MRSFSLFLSLSLVGVIALPAVAQTTTAALKKATATSTAARKAPVKPAAKSKASNAGDKAKDKAALNRKRRADALRTLQNLKKRRNSATTRRSVVESD